MAQNGYGAPAGQHFGRIPNYGKSQVNPMGNVEPPACIQNAMMTKDKKPFTYTPGGLDLSQIKTPSMARRLARQRSQEEHEQAYAQAQQQQSNGGANHYPQGNYHPQGGSGPPPPPPMNIPAPPPPPPLVIPAPTSKSPKPNTLAPGERPEIVIPDNPIGMLRKTNSPYHWEAEKAEHQRLGAVPKFVEKMPSPLTVKMPPSSFSQQPPQSYMHQNNNQRQNYPYSNTNPESPLHKPEAQYANQNYSPVGAAPPTPPTRELLQRQDSQFNKSPLPFSGQSPISNGSPFSPSPNSSWRQPEKRDSPASNVANSPQSSLNRGQFSPNNQHYSPQSQSYPHTHTPSPLYNTLPRAASRAQDDYANNNQGNNTVLFNNVNQGRPHSPRHDTTNATPWRTNTLSRQSKEPENLSSIYHNSQPHNQQAAYTPPWLKSQEVENNQIQQSSHWNQDNGNIKNQAGNQQYSPTWTSQDSNNNKVQNEYSPPCRSANESKSPQNQSQEQPRYQSSISIPVTPRKPQTEYNNTPPQKEVVYVNQEPVYFCPESPKDMPGFVKAQKEKTKTPPPIWCQRPLEGGRKSLPRELVTPPRDVNQEPEWVKLSNEMQRGVRDVVSPPRYQQPQPTWSTRPSDNRKSLPKDSPPTNCSRIVPIRMEVSSTETRDHGIQGQPNQLRITIGMQPNPNYQGQGPYSQPTQRIMRVLSPQLVRMDEGPSAQKELPTLNRSFQNNQVKERIIPIQIEGGGSEGANKRVFYHKFAQEPPPRQSKAFRVLQVITGTEDQVDLQGMEYQHGYTDL